MKAKLKALALAALLALAPTLALAQSAVLLPNGKQQFLDSNGNPLAGGSVAFYIPSTLTPKTTWADAAEATPNANPLTLDSAGEATIYGVGTYRQIVKDSLGNTIWDAQTSGLGGSTFAATSTGTANAQVISAGNFSATNGQQVSFIAGFSNTGAMTLDAGQGAAAVVRDSTTGPTALTGGEVTAGNVILAVWDSVNSEFHLVSNNTLSTVAATSQTLHAYNLGLSATVNASALTISLQTASGSAPSASNAVYVPFRSATATTGTATVAAVTASTSIVVPSGATLGTANNVATSLWVGAVYNSGTVSLVVINPLGTAPQDALVNTTTISAGSSSSGVYYGTGALSSVPVTILGRLDVNEAAAGTWASAPTLVQLATPATLGATLPHVLTSGPTSTTSGTSVTFTVPASAKWVNVNFVGVSTSSTNGIFMQLATSGGTVASGYVAAANVMSSTSITTTQATTNFGLVPTTVAASTYSGLVELSLMDASTGKWVEAGDIASSAGTLSVSGGGVTLSGQLTSVIINLGSTDAFDAGAISVDWGN